MGLFDDDNEIKEFLNNLIRVGKVTSVDYQKGTARVHFPDDDDIVSHNLPILHRNALKNKDYNMPDIDERVLCLFLPSGVETGFIIGSIYTDTVPTPESSADKRTVVFEDGSRFSYDRKTHQFDAEIKTTKITVNEKSVLVNTANEVIVTAGNNVTVNAKTANVNAETAYVLNSQTATVNAPVITLNGNVSVTGIMTVKEDVIAGKVSLVNHVHDKCAGTVPKQ